MGFVIIGANQKGMPAILCRIMLPIEFCPLLTSIIVEDMTTELFEQPLQLLTELIIIR